MLTAHAFVFASDARADRVDHRILSHHILKCASSIAPSSSRAAAAGCRRSKRTDQPPRGCCRVAARASDTRFATSDAFCLDAGARSRVQQRACSVVSVSCTWASITRSAEDDKAAGRPGGIGAAGGGGRAGTWLVAAAAVRRSVTKSQVQGQEQLVAVDALFVQISTAALPSPAPQPSRQRHSSARGGVRLRPVSTRGMCDDV